MLLFTGQILSFPCERDAENDRLTQTEIETESAALNNVSPQLCCMLCLWWKHNTHVLWFLTNCISVDLLP